MLHYEVTLVMKGVPARSCYLSNRIVGLHES
ncbi:hypothetical protein BAC_A0010 (plasmid) [Bacillus anthracis str. A0488]|uniref:Uncharacterized protein n=1 Tax=Bacillus anthracis TaxID=1392 RepID=Q6F004_BACAN|nr:hypothetical protein BX_A0012 [Bacillus anthracis str. A2012]AAT28753.2 hypothetical protein GBAA_pXO1_0012 [Bacillus anthracis str. 'Ames Ancestor']ADK08048.1 hypothetical protein BACI_pCIXO100130 [Bacillus cereus biovar anthracis str. CI]EDR16468.1 hypothetical protein BAC_A0010 [Bacillus anthracis str. A0488]EDR85193.1 hypothetical protein BAQ_A0109 [Bacillus anthracis str. A0193]EDR90646.1 hypothetical protein BAH_A0195 [Bacillus anthracis str. A0442]EDS94537.1 hypothetical protein BAK